MRQFRYTKDELDDAIEQIVHDERHRAILRRRYHDRVLLEPLAEEFDLAPRSVSDGFRDQMLNTSLNSIQTGVTSGFGDVQTALCGGFAGVNATVNGVGSTISQQLYTNQISDIERSFAAQTASTQGMSALQAQLAQCCCDNRLANCQTNNTIVSESAATRSAIQAGVQSIKDMLCQQELDAERRDNANLRSELMYARGQASQVAQTAAIEASQAAQTQYIVNRVAPYPIPAYTVANPVTPVTTAAG